MNPRILKTSFDADVATLALPTHSEHCITTQSARDMNRHLRLAAEERKASLMSQFVFADQGRGEDVQGETGNADWPIVLLRGNASRDGGIYSTQAVGLSGIVPRPVRINGVNIGFAYEDAHASYCRLHGMSPDDTGASRAEQARSVFKMAEAVLKEQGFAFADTVRTWIYLDGLLDWYDEFNRVRTAFFEKAGIFDHIVPASTGIGAGNTSKSAISMDILAVRPKSGLMKICDVVSPLQNSARDYKSSFSRAVELVFPTHRTMLISGTASIDSGGETAHMGDPRKQIELTMRVVLAILESRGMGWNDLFRGIAYFKDMAYRPIFDKFCRDMHIPRFPLAVSQADVCRHDLLFEIEVDAVKLS